MTKSNYKKLPFFALLLATTISSLGSSLTMIALPWFVYNITKSASDTGLTGFCETLPIFLAVFYSGAVLNRLGFKLSSVLSDLGSGVAVMLVPLLYATLGLDLWQLLALVFVRGLFDMPGNTARQSILPDIAELGGIKLEQANSAFQVIQNLSLLLGAPLAALLISLTNPTNVLYLDAASFGFSAILIGLLVPTSTSPVKDADAVKSIEKSGSGLGRIWHELQASWIFVWHDRLIFSLLLIVALMNFLDGPLFSVIMPIYVKQYFGTVEPLGWIVAAYGAGSIVGGSLFGMVGYRFSRRMIFSLSLLGTCVAFALLAFLPMLWVSIGILAFLGIVSGPSNPILRTLIQERIPAEMRGQIFSLIVAIARIAMPLGLLVEGLLIENIGVMVTLLLVAIGYIAVTIAVFYKATYRQMDHIKSDLATAAR